MKILNLTKTFLRCIYLAVLFMSIQAYSEIKINEILTSTSQEDNNGNVLEWIELYNSGSLDVNLAGYALSDNGNHWTFPSVSIPANGFLTVYTTGLDQQVQQQIHTNFSLKNEGETVSLFDSQIQLIDQIEYPQQRKDISYGRQSDGDGVWGYFETPTQNNTNTTPFFSGIAEVPNFSFRPGVYANTVNLEMAARQDGAAIHFTTDGSQPDDNSPIYQAPIEISTTLPVRAQVRIPGYIPSDIVTNSYIISETVDVPVMMIATDNGNLFDRRNGIYTNATQSGSQWERPTSFEYFDTSGMRLFGVDAGIRIHGGASRNRADKKSFKIYFRDEYGPSKLEARVIPSTMVDEFDSFVLRAGYNDSWVHWDELERLVATYVSDQLGRNIHEDMGGKIVSHGTYAELYLNADYWGIYNICERIDSDFLESYTGVKDWDIINDNEVVEGNRQEWSNLQRYISSTDFRSPATFDDLQNVVDLKQITSYYILNIYAQNHDWPHHNWYAVREQGPQGRWKFVVWDIEDSFGSGASRGAFNKNTFPVAQQGSLLGDLFKTMIQNEQYKDYFLQQMELYFDTTLSKDHLLLRLDEEMAKIRPVIHKEALRWNTNRNLEIWEEAGETARTFIRNREDIIRNFVYRGLGRTAPGIEPTPTPIPPVPNPDFPDALGIFANHQDIGDVAAAGDGGFFEAENTYVVAGSGADVWGTADEFHFMFLETNQNFSIEAEVNAFNLGTSDWVKGMLMVRDTLDPGAANFAIRVQESNNQISSQWRIQANDTSFSTAGANRIDSTNHDNRMRLVRDGNRVSSFYFDVNSSQWMMIDSEEIGMQNPVYVGLAVTSHDDGNFGVVEFSNLVYEPETVSIQEWTIY